MSGILLQPIQVVTMEASIKKSKTKTWRDHRRICSSYKVACRNLFGLMPKGETHCIVSKLRNCEIAKLPELAKLPKLAKLVKLAKLAKLAKFLFKFIRSFGITDYKILI